MQQKEKKKMLGKIAFRSQKVDNQFRQIYIFAVMLINTLFKC